MPGKFKDKNMLVFCSVEKVFTGLESSEKLWKEIMVEWKV